MPAQHCARWAWETPLAEPSWSVCLLLGPFFSYLPCFHGVDPHPLCCLPDLLAVAPVSLGDLSLALPGSSGLLPEALSDPDPHPLATLFYLLG